MIGFSVFLQFVAAAQISRANCDEMDGEQKLLGCRASHELCSNYLLCHLKGRMPLSISD